MTTMSRARMVRVFVNLITNAVEAMPGGGAIRIDVREACNFLLVEVEDSGPGIPPEIRERLFEPFVTAGKEQGLGLGLAFCRQTILDHGGEIWSEPAARGALHDPPPARRRSPVDPTHFSLLEPSGERALHY